ncbi:MAG: hypothetical protein QGH41_10225, partial [Roseibacillus sp.]|nr:hypothetical protein [Roseibacillus sp.]
ELFSKALHAGFLRSLLESASNPMLCPPGVVGETVCSAGAVETWMESSSFPECVVKAPFSTAGRDRVICRVAEGVPAGLQARIGNLIDRQGELVIEPWLQRLVDFSVHYDMGDGELRRRGLVVVENTDRGQFRRATVADRFTDFLEKKVCRLLFKGASRRGHLIDFLEGVLEPALAALLEKHHYTGPVGLDAFLYQDRDGAVRWKPVVEINPRYTMGRVALELARFTPSQARTSLTIAPVGQGPPGALCLTPRLAETRWAAFLSGK